ncbi:MAG: rhombosortase, partial [Acidiferrobacterales bacterium]
EEIMAGQVWRLLTGHFVHLGWQHLLLNLAGLVLTYLVFYRYLIGGQGMIAFFGIAFGVSAGLLLFNPELGWYVGLSGVLHGLLMFGAVLAVFDKTNPNNKIYIVLVVLLLIKIGYEQIIGPLPTSAVIKNYKIITVAHLYGAASGIILAVIFLVRRYLIQIKRSTA